MPEVLRIRDLGDHGVNTDVSPVDLPPEAITGGNNFRLKNGVIDTYFGRKLIGIAPTNFDATKMILHVSDTNSFYVVCGTTGVYTFDGTNWVDVTPAALILAPISAPNRFNWSICNSGTSVIINNPDIGAFYLSTAVSVFTPLPYDAAHSWLDLGKRCNFIRAHKQFLFAFGLFDATPGITQEQGINRYAWSAPADINGLPFTWDPLDLSTIAGESQLSATGGYIVDARSIRDAICIYSRNSIDLLDYVGGEFIWEARQMTSDAGIMTTNCVSEFYNKHLILTDSDILINDGNSLTSILTRKLKRRIFSTINKLSYFTSFTAVNFIDTEVWVCIPENGQDYPNIAVIYNWLENKVYFRDICVIALDGCNGVKSSNAVLWDNIPDEDRWNNYIRRWSDSPESPFDSTMAVLEYDTSTIWNVLENYNEYKDIARPERPPIWVLKEYTSFIERVTLPLNNYMGVTTVVSAYPHIECEGSVKISLGAELNQGQVGWKQPVIFTPATMKKVDIRNTGAFHAWRVESIGNVPFKISGIDFEFENNGRR